MEEIELKSFVQALILRNKGYKFKHIKLNVEPKENE